MPLKDRFALTFEATKYIRILSWRSRSTLAYCIKRAGPLGAIALKNKNKKIFMSSSKTFKAMAEMAWTCCSGTKFVQILVLICLSLYEQKSLASSSVRTLCYISGTHHVKEFQSPTLTSTTPKFACHFLTKSSWSGLRHQNTFYLQRKWDDGQWVHLIYSRINLDYHWLEYLVAWSSYWRGVHWNQQLLLIVSVKIAHHVFCFVFAWFLLSLVILNDCDCDMLNYSGSSWRTEWFETQVKSWFGTSSSGNVTSYHAFFL